MKTGRLLLKVCNETVDCFVFVVIFHHQREGEGDDGEVVRGGVVVNEQCQNEK